MKILDSFSAPFSPAVLLSQTTHPSFLCFQGFISERLRPDSHPGILKNLWILDRRRIKNQDTFKKNVK